MIPMRTPFVLLPSLLAVSCCGLFSCASTTYPEPTPTELRMGSTLQPPAGEALVIAYRRSEGLHSRMIPSAANVDGERRGFTGVGSFVVVPVSPGRHWISSGNPGIPSGSSNPIHFTARSGERYFFRQSKKQFVSDMMLVPAGPVLTAAPISGFKDEVEQVTEKTGVEEVAKCKQYGTHGNITVKTWP